MAMEIASICEL